MEAPGSGSRTRIKWRACGRDQRDRRGFVDGLEELQIDWIYGAAGYAVRFHHVEKARADSLEAAKERAERDLEAWREERRLIRERDAAEKARELRDRRAREEHVAGLVERLNTAGFAAREVFGAVTLTNEAAELLLERVSAPACRGA